MTPLFQTIFSTYKRSQDRINFFSADQLQFTENFTNLVKDIHATWEPKGCKPIFLLILHGKLVGMVNGVDTPALELDIVKYCPPEPKDDQEM